MRTTSLALLLGCNANAPTDSLDTEDTSTTRPHEALCRVDVQCPGDILDEPKAPCTVALLKSDGTAMYEGSAGFERRGRSSLWYPKPQYSMELRQYNELPVWPGAVWSYLDDGSDPGVGWKEPAFDDDAWATGGAPLGYDVDHLITIVQPSTANGSLTTFFRTTMIVENLERVTRARLGVIRDDGAAVYLNGTEILRDNLPVGADYATPASSASPNAESIAWAQIDVAPGLLHAGANTLAVEVHRADTTNDQIRFDLYLEAIGNNQSVNLDDMGADPDWILNGLYVDRVLWRNRLANDLFQSFGANERYAPESRFCELDLNGDYQGLYTLGERIGRDDDRIDIPATSVPGDSFIIKLDDVYGFHPNAVGLGTWQMVYPKDDDAAEAAVTEVLVNWEQAVRSADPADPTHGIFTYLDRDSAVDFVLLQEFMKNTDAYELSVHLWRAPDSKIYFTPWDLDLSMGYPVMDCGAEGWLVRPEYIQAMVAVPAFKEALTARWAELRQGQLAEAAILARIEGYDATLQPALERNFERWPIDEITVSTDDLPQWLCPVTSYEDEHARVLAFIAARLAWMDANIASY